MKRRRLLQTVASTGVMSMAGAGYVKAAQANNGDELWRFDIDSRIASCPTVVNNTVYVGSRDDASVYALDFTNGTEQWSWSLDWGAVQSSPQVVDGMLFTGGQSSVYGLDAATGDEQWEFQGQESGEWMYSSPTVVDGVVYTGSNEGNVYALDTDTGAKQWETETGPAGDISPTIVDGTLYIATRGSVDQDFEDGGIFVLSAETGEQEWSVEGLTMRSSPTVFEDTVYVGSDSECLHAFDKETGAEKWCFETEIGNAVRTSPTVTNGLVFFAGGSFVYAVDAETGDEHWKKNITSSNSPTVAEDRVYIGAATPDGGYVHALSIDDGSEYWKSKISDNRFGLAPIVVDGVLFIGAINDIDDGAVVALETAVEGSSEGSRVNLGTLGHHHVWANRQTPTLERIEFALTETRIEEGKTAEATVTAKFEDRPDDNVTSEATIEAEDTNVATVEGSTITGEGFGTTEIAAEYEGQNDSGLIEVEVVNTTAIQNGSASFDETVFLNEVDFEDKMATDEAVTVRESITPPDQAPPLPANVVSFSVTTLNVPVTATNETATLRYTISEEELGDYNAQDLTILHESGDEYEMLETEINEEDSVVQIAAETTGFSAFVVSIEESGPPSIIGNNKPQDLDDDGLYEDIDGDDEFTIGDVQVFFQNRNSDIVQDNSELFNFSESDPDEVTIGDVQALFQLFQEQS